MDYTKILISPCITVEENVKLSRIPMQLEIKDVLFQMATQKAPGPVVLHMLFYKYWKIVRDTIISTISNFFETGKLPHKVNNSFIVLIPKTLSPTFFNYYRSIILCNVIHKIIAKLLVSRLRHILHKLISPCHSAFLHGRWIAKN